jgi:hypothetical protein
VETAITNKNCNCGEEEQEEKNRINSGHAFIKLKCIFCREIRLGVWI